MNELIKVSYENDQPTVLGRELHERLQIKTAYKDWFPRMCEYGFEEHRDYVILPAQKRATNNPKNPWTEVTDHQLTIDMAKQICMIQRSEIGKQVREYFLELERKWNTPEAIMARALQIANNSLVAARAENKALTEQVYAQNQQIDAQTQQIAELEPKGAYYDIVLQTPNTMTTTQIAKDYAIETQVFNRVLHDIGIIYPQNRSWVLYQQHANKGYGKTNTFTYWKGDRENSSLALVWTQSGRLFLYEQLKSHNILPEVETGYSHANDSNPIVIKCRAECSENNSKFKGISHDLMEEAYKAYKEKTSPLKNIVKSLGISPTTFYKKADKYERFPDLRVY